jgi:hypothetical protein
MALPTRTFYCSKIIASGSAFALDINTGDQAFINSIVTKASGLREGDTFEGAVVPNKIDPKNTPLFVVFIEPPEGQRPPQEQNAAQVVVQPTVDERVLAHVGNLPAEYALTAEIAEALKIDRITAGNALTRLFNKGKIAKADVFSGPGLSRPSFCLWAQTANDFIEK